MTKQKELYDPHKGFPITSVCRADMERFFDEEDIAKFTDEIMERLASRMEDAYCENGFWEDLEIIGKEIIDDIDGAKLAGVVD